MSHQCKRCGKTAPDVTFRQNKGVLNQKCNDCLGNINAEPQNNALSAAQLWPLIVKKAEAIKGKGISKRKIHQLIMEKTGKEISYSVVQRLEYMDFIAKFNAVPLAEFLSIPLDHIKTNPSFASSREHKRQKTLKERRERKRFHELDHNSIAIRAFINPKLVCHYIQESA